MELIKYLDIRKRRNSKKADRWGLFFCSYCENLVEKRIDDGKKCKSCGCESISLSRKGRTKHGDGIKNSEFRSLYNVWISMKQRCYLANNLHYKYYGGRGITICDEWRKSYSKFKEFALANGWKEGLQIDRRDNDGNYEPSNCRFVTRTINMRNSSVAKLTIEQVREIREKYIPKNHTQKMLGKEYGVHRSMIGYIVCNKNWKEECEV